MAKIMLRSCARFSITHPNVNVSTSVGQLNSITHMAATSNLSKPSACWRQSSFADPVLTCKKIVSQLVRYSLWLTENEQLSELPTDVRIAADRNSTTKITAGENLKNLAKT